MHILYCASQVFTNHFHIFSAFAVCADVWFRLVYNLTFYQPWIVESLHAILLIQRWRQYKWSMAWKPQIAFNVTFELECDAFMLQVFMVTCVIPATRAHDDLSNVHLLYFIFFRILTLFPFMRAILVSCLVFGLC